MKLRASAKLTLQGEHYSMIVPVVSFHNLTSAQRSKVEVVMFHYNTQQDLLL